jgi:hypothetical protein
MTAMVRTMNTKTTLAAAAAAARWQRQQQQRDGGAAAEAAAARQRQWQQRQRSSGSGSLAATAAAWRRQRGGQQGSSTAWAAELLQEEIHQTAVLAPLLNSFFSKNGKQTVLTKNPLANDVKKHVGLIFSPAGETLTMFSAIQTVVSHRDFSHSLHATKCDKMRYRILLHLSHGISHFVAFCRIRLRFYFSKYQ